MIVNACPCSFYMVVLPWVTEGWRGTRRLIGMIVCATAADSTDGKIAGYKQEGRERRHTSSNGRCDRARVMCRSWREKNSRSVVESSMSCDLRCSIQL